jgi:hypothetical protein
MVKDAEAHAADDRQRREQADARNTADQLVYQTEKQMAELGDKLGSDARKRLEEAVSQVKDALKGDDAATMKRFKNAQALARRAGKMYARKRQTADAAIDRHTRVARPAPPKEMPAPAQSTRTSKSWTRTRRSKAHREGSSGAGQAKCPALSVEASGGRSEEPLSECVASGELELL